MTSNPEQDSKFMGNRCCQEPIQLENQLDEQMPIEVKLLRSEDVSTNAQIMQEQLDPHVLRILNEKKPFEKEIKEAESTFQWKNYANGDRYYGQLDHDCKPSGLGKLYKYDGSIIIGRFQGGVMNGQAFFANKDGLVCQGTVTNGVLNCQAGSIESPSFKYTGGIRNNAFSGKGTLQTAKSKFQGLFENGKKVEGKLSWSSEDYIYVYEGKFDETQRFSGIAKLIEPFGEYIGNFKAGEKHGKGKYAYSSGLCFEGNYTQGVKNGKGTITNKDGTLSYQGDFKNGLPHGMGRSYKNGVLVKEGNFIQGILEEAL